MFTMLNVIYDHFLTRKTQFFTLFMLSRTSDNTTSQNIGGTNAWVVPHLKFFGGTVPPVPLGLRPCMLPRLKRPSTELSAEGLGGSSYPPPLRFFRYHTFCIWNEILTF